jgi:hypothetical protein
MAIEGILLIGVCGPSSGISFGTLIGDSGARRGFGSNFLMRGDGFGSNFSGIDTHAVLLKRGASRTFFHTQGFLFKSGNIRTFFGRQNG